MKFCDKLSKLRKNNNLSQEQLADRLEMSRQAISKWELGLSYPDMTTIMELCKILNCSLENLIDDDVVGNNDFATDTKININIWIKDLLKFITKVYNMFYSMRFFEKVKCIIEMILIVFIIYFVWLIGGKITHRLLWQILAILPNFITNIMEYIFNLVYGLFGIILGFIITMHLFKIRYLDYFITVEDIAVSSKTTEKPIKELKQDKEIKKFVENKKETIIIRDPKHSAWNFIVGLSKVLMLIIKILAILIAIPCIISFALAAFLETISIWLIKDGIFFLGIAIAILGFGILNYIALETIYNLVLNRNHNLKRMFIMFISGLMVMGAGLGISFSIYLTFNSSKEDQFHNYKAISETIEMRDNLVLDFMYNENTNIIIDNNINDIKIEIEYNSIYQVDIAEHSGTNHYFIDSYYKSPYSNIEIIKMLIEDFKNKTVRNYNQNKDIYKNIKVYISEKNKEILENNFNLVHSR